MNEIEVRIKLTDDEVINIEQLIPQKFSLISENFQEDHYFKLKGRESEPDLIGSFIYRKRIEKGKYENIIFTRKETVSEGVWKEVECQFSTKNHLKFIEAALTDFTTETLVIKKRRQTFKFENITLNLDKIENLGWFIEMEILSNVENPTDVLNRLKKEFDFINRETLNKGYVQLMREKNECKKNN